MLLRWLIIAVTEAIKKNGVDTRNQFAITPQMTDTQKSRIRSSAAAAMCQAFYPSEDNNDASPYFAPYDVAKWTGQQFISQELFGIGDIRATLVECSDRLYVAFCGTVFSNKESAVRNLNTDMSCESFGNEDFDYGVHAGYKSGLNEVWRRLVDEIIDAQDEKQRPVTVTGHSLGGALATIFAVRCFVQVIGDNPDASKLRPDQVVTFGAPRPGDKQFADWVRVMELDGGCSFHRWTTSNDVVPRVPLKKQGFRHGSDEFYLDRYANVIRNPWNLRRWYDSFRQRMATKTLFDSAVGHSIENYRRKLEAAGQ